MVGNAKEPVRNYDLLSMLMICLGDPETAEYDILRLLLSNEIAAAEKQRVLQHDFAIPLTKELERGINDMCNLSEVIARENMTKGMATGIITSIKNLMKNTGWPLEQALATLEVPKEDWGKYTKILADQ